MAKFPADTQIRYIKLGTAQEYADECIESGYARLGYDSISHELCQSGEWEKVVDGKSERTKNAIKAFYTFDSSAIWITFHEGYLYWTQLAEGVKRIENADSYFKRRDCLDKQGWSRNSLNDEPLNEYCISGKLKKVKNFQGTICEPSADDHALQHINGVVPDPVENLRDSVTKSRNSLVKVLKRFDPDDLELIVDCVFRESGWNRRTQLGGQLEVRDLEVVDPLTQSDAVIQVKTGSSQSDYDDFVDAVCERGDYPADYYYFVTTQPTAELESGDEQIAMTEDGETPVKIIDATKLADWVVDVGITQWVSEKAY